MGSEEEFEGWLEEVAEEEVILMTELVHRVMIGCEECNWIRLLLPGRIGRAVDFLGDDERR